jgi:hypothetical protein
MDPAWAPYLKELLATHGPWALFSIILGWAYWQERKANIANAVADKEESKAFITALVEVKNALQQLMDVKLAFQQISELKASIQSLRDYLEYRLPKAKE